jgi:hypothetical protein
LRNNEYCSLTLPPFRGTTEYVPAMMRGFFYMGTMMMFPQQPREANTQKFGERRRLFEHKKREPLIGSLVTNTIKYTLFSAKNQVLTRWCQGFPILKN